MPIRCVALGLLLLAGKGAEASLVKLTVSAKARRCEKALEQAACAGHGVDATRGQTAEEAQVAGFIKNYGLDANPVLSHSGHRHHAHMWDVYADTEILKGTEVILAVAGCHIVNTTHGRPFREMAKQRSLAGYKNLEEFHERFEELARNFPSIAKLEDLTEMYGVEPTLEGRHIYALKISDNVQQDEDEPNQLVVGTHHARELASPEASLQAAIALLEGYNNNDAQLKAVVDDYQTYILWMMNPDGYAFVWSNNNMWRKNRRRNSDGTFGVDLNRNYPFGWSFECSGSSEPSSESYRGTQAHSEAETRTMIAFQEDRRFAKLIDLHAFARDVRQNYASCATLPSQIDEMYASVNSDIATNMNYVTVRSCCTGGDIAHAYNAHGTMALLTEIGTAFQPSFEDTRIEVAERVLPGILRMLSLPIPVAGRVLNERTRSSVVNAVITLPQLAFQYGEEVHSSSRGRYHLWLPEGRSWEALVEAPGFMPLHINLTSTPDKSETDIRLQEALGLGVRGARSAQRVDCRSAVGPR